MPFLKLDCLSRYKRIQTTRAYYDFFPVQDVGDDDVDKKDDDNTLKNVLSGPNYVNDDIDVLGNIPQKINTHSLGCNMISMS